jgi:hypothetical protein
MKHSQRFEELAGFIVAGALRKSTGEKYRESLKLIPLFHHE